MANIKKRKLPKVKRNVTFVTILKQDPELRQLISLPVILKKQILQPIKTAKNFKNIYKLALAAEIFAEAPILALLLARKKKKKLAQKKKKKKSIYSNILNELKLISKVLRGKKGETSSSEAEEKAAGDKPEEETGGKKQEEMSPWLMGLLGIGAIGGVMSLFSSNKKTEATPIKPDGTRPPQEGEQAASGEQQSTPEIDKADVDLKKIADDNSDLPDILGKEKDKIDKASEDFETKSGKKISKKEEPAPTPEAKPTPAPAPKQQEEAPANAVRTGTGGVLTDSSGAPVTSGEPVAAAPATLPPAPIPKQEAKAETKAAPTLPPAPAPEAKPAPVATPVAKPTPAPPAPIPEKKPEAQPAKQEKKVKPKVEAIPAPAPQSKPAPSASPQSGPPPSLDGVTKKQPGVETKGLNTSLEERLSKMAAAFQQETGKTLLLTSGIRSNEKQKELYDAKIKQLKGDVGAAKKLVAEPMPPLGGGKGSLHLRGLAVDINAIGAAGLNVLAGEWDKSTGWLEKFGLIRPVPKESWHVQLGGTPASPDNPNNPGGAILIANDNGAVNLKTGSTEPITKSPSTSGEEIVASSEQVGAGKKTKRNNTRVVIANEIKTVRAS